MGLLARLPAPLKRRLREGYGIARARFVDTFLAYDTDRFAECLARLGVAQGDTVLLHSSFAANHGYRGSIGGLIDALLAAVGPDGNLMMVSLPYRTSSLHYLANLKEFDVRSTPSMMGLVSEYFRRRENVVRSLHPTHPILACGARAEWIVAAHPDCLYPCGPATPFDRLLELDGKVLFFNVPFAVFTFFHYLEHLVEPDLPFRLYTDQPFHVPVIDRTGERRTVETFVFSEEAIRRRRFPVLERELRRRGLIHGRRLGNGRVEVIRVRDAVACVEDMRREGRYFYDLSDLPRVRRLGREGQMQ
jgi:aminoglycoside 3-N-acetyltransferase